MSHSDHHELDKENVQWTPEPAHYNSQKGDSLPLSPLLLPDNDDFSPSKIPKKIHSCPSHKKIRFFLQTHQPKKILHEARIPRIYDPEQTFDEQEVYDRIEEFLDREGLDIISHSPILSAATLKAVIPIKKMTSLTLISCGGSTQDSDTPLSASKLDFSGLVLPSFMARRTNSEDVVSKSKKAVKLNLINMLTMENNRVKSLD